MKSLYSVVRIFEIRTLQVSFKRNCHTAKSVMSDSINWPKVVLYGDSLTQYSFSRDGCWGALIQDKLQRKCDVINRGFSGYNTRWNKLLLPKLVSKDFLSNVVAITIFLGANDSCLVDLDPRQHVPVDEYRQNLVEMVEQLQSLGLSRDKVIFIGPPPCNEQMWAEQCRERGKPMSKSNSLVADYAKACSSAAQECGVDHIELYSSMMADKNWHKYLIDGLHFSKDGSEFLEHRLWPLVDKRTRSLLPMMPLWDQVDYLKPHTSF